MNTPEILSPQQLECFHRDGFLVMRELYGPEEMAAIRRWTGELASWPEQPGRAWMYFESRLADGARILSRIENFVPFHGGFRRLLTERRLHQAVSALFGEPAVLFKDKINFKLPGGDGFRAHQDVQAGWDRYADLHITAMVAIDATDAANGSLEIIPGLHRDGLLGPPWTPLTDVDTGQRRYQPLHCQPGDAVFFDSYAPHRSGPNSSEHARRVLYVTYNRASAGDRRAQYYADKRCNYPPDVERKPGHDYRFRV